MVDFKKQKIIDDFKTYIEIYYADIIDQNIIDDYCIMTHRTQEEKEILERRFL